MNMSGVQTICLRPHHGICIQNFIGKGYNKEFINNMWTIINKLESNHDCIIHLVSNNDVLCNHCPHNNGECDSIEKVRSLDELCLKMCGLSAGSYIKWSTFQHIVNKQILTTDAFDNVCGKCEWFNLCKETRTTHLTCTK